MGRTVNEAQQNIEWQKLVLLCLPTLSILLSTNIVMAALSDINLAFQDISGLGSWTLLLYSTTAASLSLAAGELGDRIGLRNLYGYGLIIYLLGSLTSTLSTSGAMLLAGRVISGAGAAILAPVALAFLNRLYQGGAKPIAFGYWAASVTIGTVAGPLLGGWIQAISSWRWTFIAAALPALIGLLMIKRLPEYNKQEKVSNPVDYVGIIGLSILPAIILITLTLSTRLGIINLLTAVILIITTGIITWKHLNSSKYPAVPIVRLRKSSWWRATLLQLIIRTIFMAMLVILTSYFQSIEKMNSFNASINLFPFCIAVGLMSFSSGYICKTFGTKTLLQTVFIMATVGAAILVSLNELGFRLIDWLAVILIGFLAGSTSQLSRISMSNFSTDESMRGASLNTLVINLGLAFGAAYPNLIHGTISAELHIGSIISMQELILISRLEISMLLVLFAIGTIQSFKLQESR